jgi:hypothetical protein
MTTTSIRQPRAAYESSPIKRARRTKADIVAIETAIFETLEADHPQTVRGLFYQLVSQGVVPKTEAAYKGLVGRLCVRMRRADVLPYESLADNTRWMRKPTTYVGLEAALTRTAETYRRALWADGASYVEVWLEKDALAGVLYTVTGQWDVPLMVTRGYPSLSYLFEAAEALKAAGKTAYLYYFGDYDPSGVDIPRKVEAELRRMAPSVEIHFTRVAVTEEQIGQLNLPTRPTKDSDSRSKGFGRASVEVDAIPARLLRMMTEDCINRHVDPQQLATIYAAEASERTILDAFSVKVTTARQCGVSLDAIDRVYALEQLAPVLYHRVLDGELTMDKAESLVRRAVRKRTT